MPAFPQNANSSDDLMPELLTLTRAARLVGISRGALQKKIKDGELATFEGKVRSEDLLRSYPNAKLEDNTGLERLSFIKDSAYGLRIRERILPDPEVLAARLKALSKELVEARAALERQRVAGERLQQKIAELESVGPAEVSRAAAALRVWLQQELASDSAPAAAHPLLVQHNFLRLMAAHVRLNPSNHEFLVEGADTILDAALRAGLALNYGCSNGNCGLCKARIVSGEIKKVRAHDFVLTEAEKLRGYALMCSNTAVTDLVIEAGEAGGVEDIPLQQIAARVKSLQRLGDDIVLLHLQTPRINRLRFLAGQYVNLQAGGVRADHHIASCPCDDRNLQFHIPRLPHSAFAEYVFTKLKPGDVVAIEGPAGDFVLKEDSRNPLMFIACDTGFAPIKSLLEHAMALNAAETVALAWISAHERGHYQHNLCRAWTDALDDMHYLPRVAASDDEFAKAITEIAHESDIKKYDVYIAGTEKRSARAAHILRDYGVPHSQLFVEHTL